MTEKDLPKYGTPEWDLYVASERERLRERLRERIAGVEDVHVFNTDEMMEEFEIESFGAPFAFGRRKSSGNKVTLQFQHSPRFYWVVKEELA